MRKVISVLLAFMMFLTPSASAIILDDTDTHWMIGVHTDGINNDPYDQAEMLKELDLFMGTDKGFELERSMTRAEAAVMLVRFLGAEDKVLGGTWNHPFNDVPQWVDKYIGWLYQSGLTRGLSEIKYGPADKATMEQYAIFLSRALAGNDNWDINGIATVDEVKLWDEENCFFPRAAAVGMSVRVLTLTYTRNDNWTYSMAQYLIDHGVFTAKQLLEAAWGVLPPVYCYLDEQNHIYNTVAGVAVAKTCVGGLYNMTGTDSSMSYFYASAVEGQKVTLYQIDCKTMKNSIISSRILPGDSKWVYTYASSIDGKDYLFEHSYGEDNKVNLVRCDNGQLTVVLLDFKFFKDGVYPDLNWNYFISDNSILIAGGSQYYLVNKNGIKSHELVEGTQILGFDSTCIVTQLATKESTTISCLHAIDGVMIDSYTVEQDMQDDYNLRTVVAREHHRYYGEAGLYVLDIENERLEQITALPALDITSFRMDDRYIILTHDPGQRIYGGNRYGGNEIVIIENDGSERVLLTNTPPHGISIAGFENPEIASAVAFYSVNDVGMQHFNKFSYILLPSFDSATGTYDAKQSQIIVTGYTAGRPELEATDYEQSYIKKEQERLNATKREPSPVAFFLS
jgi:hypothetical protein